MKTHISNTLSRLLQDDVATGQVRLEFLKYEIRKFTVTFQKTSLQEARIGGEKFKVNENFLKTN